MPAQRAVAGQRSPASGTGLVLHAFATRRAVRIVHGQSRAGPTACLWHVQAQGQYRVGLGLAHEFNAGPADSWQTLENRWRDMAATAVVRGDHRPTLFGGFAFDRRQPEHACGATFPTPR